MTDTPEGFKAARRKLGLSTNQLGRLMKVDPVTIRRWEMAEKYTSHRKIPGPVIVLMDWFLGKKPRLPASRTRDPT